MLFLTAKYKNMKESKLKLKHRSLLKTRHLLSYFLVGYIVTVSMFLTVLTSHLHVKEYGEVGQSGSNTREIVALPSLSEKRKISRTTYDHHHQQQRTLSTSNTRKALLLFPTIPVPFKGSDTRPIETAKILTRINKNSTTGADKIAHHSVDFMYWRPFSTELSLVYHSNMTQYDEARDRQTLHNSGVRTILGPYDGGLAEIVKKLQDTDLSYYDVAFFWPWPDPSWLDALSLMVEAVKRQNSFTKIIAMVEDPGLAARNLWEDALSNGVVIGLHDIHDYLISTLQHGNEWTYGEDKKRARDLFDSRQLSIARRIFSHEYYLYSLSDMVIGISSETIEYLSKLVPTKEKALLPYLSPTSNQVKSSNDIVPFTNRSGILFFGYNNPANNMALSWFAREVMPHIDQNVTLHVAGHVYVPDNCKCDMNGRCESVNNRVQCHGPVDEDTLNALIESSLIVINPVLTTAGVATKTCRAMSFGTPVVVSDGDGTFKGKTSEEIGSGAGICELDDQREGVEDKVLCFARRVNELTNSEERWNLASTAAPLFITKVYGYAGFENSWNSILTSIYNMPIQVVIEGIAARDGLSLFSQNWYIAKGIQEMSTDQHPFKVSIVGGTSVDPPIEGVRHISDRFELGFKADFIIRQSWPTPIEASSNYCGIPCRIATILPWEFGTLPSSWIDKLDQSSDILWAPTEYNRKVYENSGFNSQRSNVIYCGVECSNLLDNTLGLSISNEKVKKSIKFVMSGGVLPRKGFDIALEEWKNLFCNVDHTHDPPPELEIHSGYEYGYSDEDFLRMNQLISSCKNGSIKWHRNSWQQRKEYIQNLFEADFYLAPFRAEGFGISIAEAVLLKTPVITTFDVNVPTEDYLSPVKDMVFENGIRAVYPITAISQQCTTFPCKGKNLCVFADREDPCEELVQEPTWFEPDRRSLRIQLEAAYHHAIRAKHASQKNNMLNENMLHVCWPRVSNMYKENIMRAISLPMQRRIKGDDIVVAGLVADAGLLTHQALNFIVDMSCKQSVSVNIVIGKGLEELYWLYHEKVRQQYPSKHCALFKVTQEPDALSNDRISRIQSLREFQRSHIQKEMPLKDTEKGVIILVDFDMSRFASTKLIIEYANEIKANKIDVDVLCSNGELGYGNEAGRYYDTFATVLLPDTFVHPLEWRLHNQRPSDEEDPQFILSPDDANGTFTSSNLFNWFKSEGMKASNQTKPKPVPVRSCFGGISIYRAKKYSIFFS